MIKSNYEKFHFEDFTEKNYKKLILQTKKFYRFSSFTEINRVPHVLWRHDVDLSVHRAVRLAEIEKKLGVKTTYFFHLHSYFYNLFEKEITEKIFRIIKLGHFIGLHFEPAFYSNNITKNIFMKAIKFEKNVLEELFGIKIKVFSFHNPENYILKKFDHDVIADMTNTYGKSLRDYQYVSDSNGYWRFKRLEDVLQEHESSKLHVLTHPEWWQKNPISPKERVLRCIEFRSKNTEKNYLKILRKFNRKNIV